MMKSLEAVKGLGPDALNDFKARLKPVKKETEVEVPLTKARLQGAAYVTAVMAFIFSLKGYVRLPICIFLMSPIVFLQCGFFGGGIKEMSLWERVLWELDQYQKRRQRAVLKKMQSKWKNAKEVPAVFDVGPCPRFDVDDPRMLSHLQEEGFVVVKGVADSTGCDHAKDLLWKFLEQNTDMSRHDPDTWTNTEMHKVGDSTTGILMNAGFGHSEFVWNARLLPAVKRAFANVWKTNDLIVSFDGGNLFRPFHRSAQTKNWKTSGNWFHVDQGRKNPGFCCVQGIVSFYDANEETGGLCVVPKSHLQHAELMTYASCNDNDLVPVPIHDPALNHKRLVTCKAGDLILWDSRTFHCNTPARKTPTSPTTEPIRAVSYVCMTPTRLANKLVIDNRKQAFLAGLGTSHWPHLFKPASRPSWNHELFPTPERKLEMEQHLAAKASIAQMQLIGG